MMNASKVEVLVAAVGQNPKELYKKMNIRTDAIIANQSDNYAYFEEIIEGKHLKILQTSERGVGKNRNLALLNAKGEYLLFSDEDIVYRDDYEKMIVDGFKRHPDADLLIFDLNYAKATKSLEREKIRKEKRAFIFNAMKYGTPRYAVKRDSLQKANVWFSLLYGGGAPHACGEDSLFLSDILRKKLKVYVIPDVIADLQQTESSWFHGYDDKFFKDKGMLIKNIFPIFGYVYIIILSWKFAHRADGYSFGRIFCLMMDGVKYYKNK